jgi:hypothetical protein
MYLALLILGMMVALGGAAAVSFGIPIKEFGFGNTLIMAGTVAFVGGLILIGLSQAVRQLRRIAESLMARPVGRMPRGNEAFEPVPDAAAQAGPRIPFPPKPAARPRAPAAARAQEDPRLDIAPSLDAGEEPAEPRRAFARATPLPRAVPERDDTPLAPKAEPRLTPVPEPKDELAEGLLATAFSRLDVSLRPAPPPLGESARQQKELFEPLRPPEPEDLDAEPGHTEAEASEAGQPQEAMQEQKEEQPAAPYAISILKSGMVDGMAYTLYSDGSIEAEMPQGTMRFASITELRAYLEQSLG